MRDVVYGRTLSIENKSRPVKGYIPKLTYIGLVCYFVSSMWTLRYYSQNNFQVKSAVSSIIGGGRKGTTSHGGGTHGGRASVLGGGAAAAGLAQKSSGNGKLLKKVGKYAVVGLAG